MRTRRFLLLILLPFTLAAQETPLRLEEVASPSLLIRTSRPDLYLPAPTVETKITMNVRGMIARAHVRQLFDNPTPGCIEAVYVFPLPENAAVDTLRMRVGPRVIEGEIREREEAKLVYEQAKADGKRASLLEQQRPNLFTVSLSSIPAGERAEIEIEYQQILTFDDGRYSLRFPLAVAPRYEPPATTGIAVPLPKMNHHPTSARRNPAEIEIDLDSGIALQSIGSGSHEVGIVPIATNRYRITGGPLPSDRDFELAWAPRLGSQPDAAVFTETFEGEQYALMVVFPPDLTQKQAAVIPRDVIFIIDTSGSMGGPSMEQAREALLLAIDRLRPSDSFNVIEFDDDAHALFTAMRTANRAAIEEAKEWVASLEADGGTEMLAALKIALASGHVNAVRQVVFITDGQVGNEREILGFIRSHLGTNRLFTVGIGSAPNSYFMRSAARFGRGTFSYIGKIDEVEERMGELFRKLENPVLSNIEISLGGAEVWPPQIQDLYAGEPLVVTAKVKRPSPRAEVQGNIGSTRWSEALAMTAEQRESGIHRLWARQKIEALSDSVVSGESPDAVRTSVIDVALRHHLVSEHTSLVAVDQTPAGADARSCTPELVPLNLPAGWGGLGPEGSLPQTATDARFWIIAGLALFAAAIALLR